MIQLSKKAALLNIDVSWLGITKVTDAEQRWLGYFFLQGQGFVTQILQVAEYLFQKVIFSYLKLPEILACKNSAQGVRKDVRIPVNNQKKSLLSDFSTCWC